MSTSASNTSPPSSSEDYTGRPFYDLMVRFGAPLKWYKDSQEYKDAAFIAVFKPGEDGVRRHKTVLAKDEDDAVSDGWIPVFPRGPTDPETDSDDHHEPWNPSMLPRFSTKTLDPPFKAVIRLTPGQLYPRPSEVGAGWGEYDQLQEWRAQDRIIDKRLPAPVNWDDDSEPLTFVSYDEDGTMHDHPELADMSSDVNPHNAEDLPLSMWQLLNGVDESGLPSATTVFGTKGRRRVPSLGEGEVAR